MLMQLMLPITCISSTFFIDGEKFFATSLCSSLPISYNFKFGGLFYSKINTNNQKNERRLCLMILPFPDTLSDDANDVIPSFCHPKSADFLIQNLICRLKNFAFLKDITNEKKKKYVNHLYGNCSKAEGKDLYFISARHWIPFKRVKELPTFLLSYLS